MSLSSRHKTDFRLMHEFKRDVKDHLDWSSRHQTPFVSTFASRQHAVNWAHDRIESGSRNVVILELDPRQLGSIFCVRHLVKHRRLQVYTELPENMYRDEYLVLDRIPRRSILCKIDPRDYGRGHVSEESNFGGCDSDSDGYGYDSDESDSDDSDLAYYLGR